MNVKALSSLAYHASTKVTTNQMNSRMAVMTRFLRQYSLCFSVSCIFPLLLIFFRTTD